ncbi:MAG: 23S rRNA pseudouridine(1911/1915/1917) synthase RluD [Legionella sp.]|jgi:23S rRNA pseudouridine1911/1915/1917 synthase|nr:23S rRNA pseudouridine(1911/1915/1917) synthase RluD [Legionella sp.]
MHEKNLSEQWMVPVELAGERVDRILAQLCPMFSRSQLTNWLKAGFVTVNNQQLKPKTKLEGGECIILTRPIDIAVPATSQFIPEAIPLDIAYEDDDLMVINKPAGLVVHPGAGNRAHTLVNALVHHNASLNQLPRAGIIHRLDKETTGLLLVGKTLESYTALVRQMQAREIDRHYVTLVQGHIISGQTLKTLYGRHPRQRLKMAVCETGKEAITSYTVKKHYPKAGATFLDVKLMTGRTHQIRVHMAHIHHPIIGDPLYGGRPRHPVGLSDEARDVFLGFKRQALHAKTLNFAHPMRDEHLTFEAPLPQDFQNLLDALDA